MFRYCFCHTSGGKYKKNAEKIIKNYLFTILIKSHNTNTSLIC